MTEALVNTAKGIVDRLRAAGFEAYFVGGCVRDLVMGKQAKDIDVATNALPEQVGKLFRRTILVGAQFGVVRVLEAGHEFEVATFRADGEYLDGRHPVKVTFCDARADVLRRDFTINGMLYDPVTDSVIDHVGGKEDIAKRVVRCIGDPVERFQEDKVRVMRAVRFACRLGFVVAPDTSAAAKRIAPKIAEVSAERVRDELLRILMEGGAAKGVQMLRDFGVLEVILPEVVAMEGVPQPEEFHPEGDVLTHTMLALGEMVNPTPQLAMAVLLHDVGKPTCFTDDDRVRFHRHEQVGADTARRICRRLKFSNAQTEVITWLVANHMRVADAPKMRIGRLKRLLREPDFEELLELHRVDCLACHRQMDKWEFCKSKLAEVSQEELRPEPLLSGSDLIDMGYRPGPIFKEILRAVETAQLEGEIATREDAAGFVRARFRRD